MYYNLAKPQNPKTHIGNEMLCVERKIYLQQHFWQTPVVISHVFIESTGKESMRVV